MLWVGSDQAVDEGEPVWKQGSPEVNSPVRQVTKLFSIFFSVPFSLAELSVVREHSDSDLVIDFDRIVRNVGVSSPDLPPLSSLASSSQLHHLWSSL